MLKNNQQETKNSNLAIVYFTHFSINHNKISDNCGENAKQNKDK